MSYRRSAAAAASVLAVGVAGCGGGSSDTADAGAKPAKKAAQTAAKATGGRLAVVMSEYKFAPSKLTAGAGKLKVTAKNTGRLPHEFVLLRTNASPDAIPLKGDEASESSSVGEIGEREPGKTGTHSFKLKPGRYVFICNVQGHYKLGMRGSLVVR
jgi:uncharacterized cupredoxin-like copper-binding protein